ncbi:hypothetical protein GCM10014719_17460 [Planomonospora parontospora subsp. antibiotica]|nr:hypothetical protein GCM10014719_17460 [Planomonospora parontospora subsp. antibiotica]GII16020.1 hypothetical protein Ppa05_27460 [Planomonospora parontospora subsp. antibiotica]
MTWWTIITDPVGRALPSGMTGSFFHRGSEGWGCRRRRPCLPGRREVRERTGPVSSTAGRVMPSGKGRRRDIPADITDGKETNTDSQ